jgi:hypothetical protein
MQRSIRRSTQPSIRHHKAVALGVVPMCLGLALSAAPTYAGTTGSRAVKSTSFAFKASGYGTKLNGGQIPAGSSTTGSRAIGCTHQAGRSRTNNVAEATLPGLGRASGVRTRVWTTSRHGVLASHSTHSIAEVTLARSGLGALSIRAITSRATAYHDARGFHARTATRIGGLVFTPPVGAEQAFPLPTPDHPVTIPGLATVYAGQHSRGHSSTGATADAYALRVEVLPTGTSVRVAHSHAALYSGLTAGVFGGHAAATRVVTAAGDIVKSGPNPLTLMPCQGTYGTLREKSLAEVDLGGQLVAKGADARTRAAQGTRRAHGMSRAGVAQVSIGGDQVVVDGIVAKATVVRSGNGVVKSAKGTRLASVTVAGHRQTFPRTGVLEIPGVVKLERAVVKRTANGISVIGLRITLLDGSGAVVDLAEAELRVRPVT